MKYKTQALFMMLMLSISKAVWAVDFVWIDDSFSLSGRIEKYCDADLIKSTFTKLASCPTPAPCSGLIQKAYDEGEIDIREKRYLTEHNMVPVFDESGYVDGFKLCDTP